MHLFHYHYKVVYLQYRVNSKRKFSSKVESKLDPFWVTGFFDAEGSFVISIYESKDRAIGWRVAPEFKITLHKRDEVILNNIKEFFGVGTITSYKYTLNYKVRTLKDITEIIIPHFEKYPLITQKKADYELFKQVILIIKDKNQLDKNALQEIVNIRAYLGWGLSYKLLNEFPNTNPVTRPIIKDQEIKNPFWLTGFTDGEGSFMVSMSKVNNTLKERIQLEFKLTQHSRDIELMKYIALYLNCGNAYENRNAIDYRVVKLSDIIEKIIPFFQTYPLLGIKYLDFSDFVKLANLLNEKEHLTIEGLTKIK